MTGIENRYEFVLVFDVKNGNPNGDPAAGNLPRLDPETGHGLISDVSLKRKIRNYAELARGGEPGWRIYVQEGAVLNEHHREAYLAIRSDDKNTASEKKLNPRSDGEMEALRQWMCANFFDIRTFGAVMSTGINCGQVRGPVQLAFANSVEPILPMEVSITRMAATNAREKSAGQDEDDDNERVENRTIGRKYIVPYALYRAHGYISAPLAERSGFSTDDLTFLFEALQNMFEHHRSSTRGEMATRKLIVFKHASRLGNAHAQHLFDRVKIRRMINGEPRDIGDHGIDNHPPARKYADYDILIDKHALPAGIEIMELI